MEKNDQLELDREKMFYRYCKGITNSRETELVETLIAHSQELTEELENVAEAVHFADRIKEVEKYNSSRSFVKVQRKIKNRYNKRKILLGISRVAAFFTIPLLISTFIFGTLLFNKYRIDSSEIIEVRSSTGTVSSFELPDGSKIWLNAESKLRYPSSFKGKAREVELEGEAFFEITSSLEHPFYVSTMSGVKVLAHGTQFNINTEDGEVETTLVEGKVDILLGKRLLKELVPGEKADFNPGKNQLEIRRVNTDEFTAWKDGKIIFRNAPLNEVFKQLSRKYNVDISLHDEKNIVDKYSARITFTDETIQQIFTYLEVAAPIKWTISTQKQKEDSTLTKQKIDVWIKSK